MQAQNAGKFITVPLPLFRGAPITQDYRKVQGLVTRTELEQRRPTLVYYTNQTKKLIDRDKYGKLYDNIHLYFVIDTAKTDQIIRQE